MIIRPEQAGDEAIIHAVTQKAFAGTSYSDGSEPFIIGALREDGDLFLSLVALRGSDIVGHIAFSPVKISQVSDHWYGLGPVSVRPDLQGQGIGGALIKKGLASIKTQEAKGVVLIGNPDYYSRFGFFSDPGLTYGDLDIRFVQQLPLAQFKASGTIQYSPAFERSYPNKSG